MANNETHHLPGSHAGSLDTKLAATHVKEVLHAGPEKVDDENVMETLLTKVVDLGYSGWAEIRKLGSKAYGDTIMMLTSAGESAVGSTLVSQLWRVRLAGLL